MSTRTYNDYSIDSHVQLELPPDDRSRALARLAAIEVSNDPDVARFRARHLPGGLLRSDDLPRWVTNHAKDESGTGVVLSIPAGPFWPRSPTPINAKPGGMVEELAAAAWSAAHSFGWSYDSELDDTERARLVGLVLTGEIDLPRGRLTARRLGGATDFTMINLRVNTRVSRKELTDLYTAARNELGRKGRDIRELWRADLAVFIAEANDGRTWREAMAEWNTRQPGHIYESARRFASDCRDSYRRLRGTPLKWQASGTPEATEANAPG